MQKPILIGNWKNKPKSDKEALTLLTGLNRRAALYKKLSVVIAPPYVYFESTAKRAARFAMLGTQDIFSANEGSHTGSITPDILKSFGVKFAIVGHSERRAIGETNEVVATKVRSALTAGMVAVLCIGESARDAEGTHLQFIREQLKFSLEGIRKSEAEKLIIAYEPIWAIGKKASEAANASDITEMVIFIKKTLTDIFGRAAAETIPVLYGGSVEGANAAALYKGTGVRGFLIGHASVEPTEFAHIAEALIAKE